MVPRTMSRDESPFAVPPVLHFLGGLVQRFPDFWLGLGRLETSLLASQLCRTPLTAPIFICGLARSGSTLLHEIIASHPGVATHRVKDYPMVFTPYWWRRATANQRSRPARERPHADRVMISADSPDALEEMVWLPFFPRCHDPSACSVLGANDKHAAFERFYTAHLRKVILAEQATRYVAKANYHVARLSYLIRLFPDARFLIPVRAPQSHVSSLMRQQAHFTAGQRRHRTSLVYMQRSGHFEFGLDRRPMNVGDGDVVRRIQAAWAAGDEARGTALSWASVYGFLAQLLQRDARVRQASLVVPFETICAAPAQTLRAVAEHCRLPDADGIVQRHATAIRYPTYYDSKLTEDETAAIRSETAATARLWGY
jgi:hypothetical protein